MNSGVNSARFASFNRPEILRVDLAEPVLQTRLLGHANPAAFPWLDAPPPAAVEAAVCLLIDLGALRQPGLEVTAAGRQMSALPMHPRLARLLLGAADRGCLREACLAAAVLSERIPAASQNQPDERTEGAKTQRNPLLRASASSVEPTTHNPQPATPDSDLLRVMRRFGPHGGEAHSPAGRQILRTEAHFVQICRRQHLHVNPQPAPPAELIKSFLQAYPDHLARRRDLGTLLCELRNGRRGELDKGSAARHEPLLVVAEIRETGGRGQAARTVLSLASGIREDWLRELFPDAWRHETVLEWNIPQELVEKRLRTFCLDVLMEEKVLPGHGEPGAGALIAGILRDRSLHLPEWNDAVETWISRVRWVAGIFPERGLITYDDADRDLLLHELCDGEWRLAKVREKSVLGPAKELLSHEDRQFVERMAPEQLPLPNGRRMRLKYTPGQPPHGSARIADLFDLRQTPRVAAGRAPVLLEILAPNQRPVQITDDLAGFWERHYPAIKKTLSRKYPRHEWR